MLTRHRISLVAFAALLVSAAAFAPAAQSSPAVPIAPEARVDINHATMAELVKVPGMTPSWAGRIIRFRPYRSKDELVTRGVITGSEYKRIKDYVIAHRDPQ